MTAKGGRPKKGSIDERGPMQFRARITLGGKTYIETLATRADAQAWLDRLITASRTDGRLERAAKAAELTLAEALRIRLDLKKNTLRSDQRPATEQLIKNYPELTGKLIYSVDEIDIEDFVAERSERGAAPGTVNKDLGLISNTFNLARTKMACVGLRNPIGPTTRLREPPGIERRLSPEEEAEILAAAAAYQALNTVPMCSVLQFSSDTAMRLGEIAKMRWEDVNLAKGTVRLGVTKNGEARTVPLWPRSRELLLEMGPQKSGPVWGHRDAIKTAWKRIRKAAAKSAAARGDHALAASILTYRYHDYRHEGTSRLIEKTDWENAKLKAVTGHKTDAMLTRYSHVKAAKLAREMAAIAGVDYGDEEAAELAAAVPDIEVPESIKLRARWKAVSNSRELLEMLLAVKSQKEIGADYGVSDVAVYKACVRLGLKQKGAKRSAPMAACINASSCMLWRRDVVV
jgi:integrase